MTSRRTFLHTGVAVAAAGALGGVGISFGSLPNVRTASTGCRPTLHAVVVDERFAESVEFGRTLALLGAHAYSMQGDVTDVWYSRLHPLWKTGGVAVAGLTGSGVLFCLERLAWDHGLRVVHRGSHQRIGDGQVQHAMLGSARWDTAYRSAAGRNAPWPATLATAVAGIEFPCVAVATARALRPVCTTVSTGRGSTADSPLFSWVIAPPARA